MFLKKRFLSMVVTIFMTFSVVYIDAKPVEITKDNFEEVVKQNSLPVILKVSATWCPPCQVNKPIFEQLAQKYDGKCALVTMDLNSNVELVQELEVTCVPTFFFFYKGKLISKLEGCPSNAEDFEKLIEDALAYVAGYPVKS